jgi:formylglycine-generating enzyme required for sulfatase activity/uncharacterized caspase-like protein
MAKNWAIAIGINEYINLQSLHYAKRDAESMQDFFKEAGFDQVFLFTDVSEKILGSIPTQPTYGNLRRFLRFQFEEPLLEAGDNLWFFFAGHGIREAERDYLMPCDVDPGDVEHTAIPISFVTERLRRSGADNVILLLDACRNEGSRDGLGIGEERQPGVVTIFSCSPKERSWEIEALRQGSFSHALLEALRIQGEGNCATVERLYHHLCRRVPEINRQYQKHRQTPYAIAEPATKYHLILLPKYATVNDRATLKMDAYKAEMEGNYELARQLWIRVNVAAAGSDLDVIAAFQRISQRQGQPTAPSQPEPITTQSGERASSAPQREPTPSPPQPPLAQERLETEEPDSSLLPLNRIRRKTSSSSKPARSSSPNSQSRINLPSLPIRLTRRRLLQLLGLMGGGVGTTFLLRTPLQLSTRKQESTPTPEPTKISTTPFEFNVVTVNAKGQATKPSRKQAQYFSENLGDGVSLEMVAIPGGTFLMGSPATEKGHDDRESPQHKVTVKSFFMGRYPVTQAQWRVVVALAKVKHDLNPNPSGFKGDNRPVDQVSWDDAVEFCARLSQKTGWEYRLPSEAEWEYACRAGTTTPFHFGETITPDLANYDSSSTYGAGTQGKYRGETTPVGSFQVANAFGLYDMHGNVWEWCADHWHTNYQGAPTDGSAWLDKNDKKLRMLRGGSWVSYPVLCRSAFRLFYTPGVRHDDTFGFRIVCAVA